MKKNNKNNVKDKKWLIIGSIFLFIIAVFCFGISKFSSIEIISKKKNALAAGTYSVRLKKASDSELLKVLTAPSGGWGFSIKLNGSTRNNYDHDMNWIHYVDVNKNGTLDSGDVYAFCIEMGESANSENKSASATSSYWNALTQDARNGIELALYYGFPNSELGTSYKSEAKLFATQLMIWEFQQGWRTFKNGVTVSTSPFKEKIVSKNSGLKGAYEALEKAINGHYVKPSISLSELKYSDGKWTGSATDSNKVLSSYSISSCNGMICTKNGNNLTVESSSSLASNGTVEFVKKFNKPSQAMLFIDDNGNSQVRLFGAKQPSNITYSISITTEKLGEIVINKTSEDGEKDGFIFLITGPNGYSKEVTTKDGTAKVTDLKLGTYTVSEKVTHDQYLPVKDQTATLSTSKTTATLSFYNELKNTSSVVVRKIDKETGEPLPDAKLGIKDSAISLTYIESWKTTLDPYIVKKSLEIGKKYYLCEIEVPNGYKNAGCQEFTVKNKNEKVNLVVENIPNKLVIKKVDEAGKPVEGAHLQLFHGSEKIDDWVTDSSGEKYIDRLTIGEKYVIKEESAPDKYVKASDMEFKYTSSTSVVKFEDVLNEVLIYKYNESKQIIGGANLKIVDENKEVVAEWNSVEGKVKQFRGLKRGKYTLIEEKAPDGYLKSESKEFVIDENTKSLSVEMVDDPTIVEFSKISATTGEEIGGAHLQITDPKGDIVDEWVSVDNETHIVKGKLNEGIDYTLTETQAPDGYVVAESINFRINGEPVVMKNKLTEVRVFKKDVVSGKLVGGAHLQLLDSEGNIIREWDSSNLSEEVFYGLKAGDYKVKETKVPQNYLESEIVPFTVSSVDGKPNDVIVYNTPIVDVPNTAVDSSIVAIISGVILILGGAGTVLWMRKRNS